MIDRRRGECWGLAVGLLLVALPGRTAGDFFSDKVAPLLEQHCLRCHGEKAPKGGLRLTTAKNALTGGDSGPAIVPGKSKESRLIEVVSGPKPRMPRNAPPLTVAQVAVLTRWIEDGAKWPEGKTLQARKADAGPWWSLQPLVKTEPPSVKTEEWVQTPIDRFILARLEKERLSPRPEADRRTLIRRLTFDLTGLPPTPEEIDGFVGDKAADAYEKLVDRLLASPRYGERWGRHWLDAVHYGDTHGYDKDKLRPNAWPYRDYVIRAFNEDKGYSRFVREQLAGDVMYPGTSDGIIALGFLAAGPWDFVGHAELREGTLDKKITRTLDRDDMVATAMNTFVSLTVQCARCHDHKFDPIAQEDYYSLQAVFAAVDRADRPYEEDPTVGFKRAILDRSLADLTARKAALDGKAKGEKPLSEELKREIGEVEKEIRDAQAKKAALPPPGVVYAAATHFKPLGTFTPTNGKPRPVYVLRRGSEKDPVREVGPGTVGCVPDLPSRFDLGKDHAEGDRRAALAKWVTDKNNPLTWRSIVNRVWHYHFGQGLVDTPNDFGRMGGKPSHPELLDWLAVHFRDNGQSLKKLHRLLVTSAVYRQSSAHDAGAAKVDGGNRLLWRMNRRKLEAEAVRDAVLAVSGKLDLTAGGPGYRAFGFEDDHSPVYKYEEHDPDDPRSQRRSVYRFLVRSVPDPFFETLDCADPSLIVEKRNETLTALQALALLNNRFMTRMAEHLAARVEKLGKDVPGRVSAAYRLALGREPAADELELLTTYVRKHGLANGCRLILNTNEFAFVD